MSDENKPRDEGKNASDSAVETIEQQSETGDSSGKNIFKNPKVYLSLVGLLIVGLCLAPFVVVWASSVTWVDMAAFTAVVRNIFIILLVLESIVFGIAVIILISQFSALKNLLQSEVRPILESSQQAADTVKGTAAFMSEHVAEPVIRTSATMAAGSALVREVLGIRRALKAQDRPERKQENKENDDNSENE